MPRWSSWQYKVPTIQCARFLDLDGTRGSSQFRVEAGQTWRLGSASDRRPDSRLTETDSTDHHFRHVAQVDKSLSERSPRNQP